MPRRIKLLEETTAHKEPRAFLKALVQLLDTDERRELSENLAKAERKESCLRHAVFLMIVLLMISVAGLGYCAVLLPEVFHNPSHPFMRSFSVLGLGSLIAQGVFLAYLLWHRTTVTGLQAECRRLVLALACSQREGPAEPCPPGPVPAPTAAGGSVSSPQPLSQETFLKSS